MKCPHCGKELKEINFFMFSCSCGKEWAITEITSKNRGYYN